MTTHAPPRRWWLVVNSQVDGPRTETYILAGLQSGQIQPTTQACPEGGNEWRPLSAWPEWQGRTSTGTSPPTLPHVAHNSYAAAGSLPNAYDRLVTNPALPPMANAICVFTIVLLPLYWIFGVITTLVAPGTTEDEIGFSMISLVIGAPIALAITILLAVGGLRLRSLRSSGVRLLKLGLIIDFVFIALSLIFTILIMIAIVMGGEVQESTPNGAGTFFAAIEGVAGIAALAFEIVAFIWLLRFANSLPLRHE